MRPLYWYDINDLPHREGSQIYFIMSPGHYGRRLSDIQKSISALSSKLEEARLSYRRPRLEDGWITLEENSEPQVEMSNLMIDRGMMRVVLDTKTDAPAKVLEDRLDGIGFMRGQPERF